MCQTTIADPKKTALNHRPLQHRNLVIYFHFALYCSLSWFSSHPRKYRTPNKRQRLKDSTLSEAPIPTTGYHSDCFIVSSADTPDLLGIFKHTFIFPWISLAFFRANTWMWLETCEQVSEREGERGRREEGKEGVREGRREGGREEGGWEGKRINQFGSADIPSAGVN